uniref:Large ribosomal subunit protein bL25 n=1 Tax=uncultured Chloroflexi bacterium HF0500_03M05 TaxID=710737 RepID=E0XY78_9CHLR|nr:ribosomal protein l25 (general stress protein ctc) [uncultured Chloroflexi bacterium HF0500_03M05]
MDTLNLKLSPREVKGKKVKRLRQAGVVPVHFFGGDIESQALQVEARVLRRLVKSAGTNIPITVEVEGQDGENICFIREVQRHPVTEDLLHVDFLRVDVSQTVTANVPIILDGSAPAVENSGGTLIQPLQTLVVESLPMNIPAAIHVDVSDLDDFEKSIRVRDVQVSSGVTLLADLGEMITRVLPPRVDEPEVTAGGELDEAEGLDGDVPVAEVGDRKIE